MLNFDVKIVFALCGETSTAERASELNLRGMDRVLVGMQSSCDGRFHNEGGTGRQTNRQML